MTQTIHNLGSYGLLFCFLVSCALGVLALVRKQAEIERLSAWGFVLSAVLLGLVYMTGFAARDGLGPMTPALTKLATRHHEMAKFVLTGMILIGCAALTVLYKFRKEKFPAWFLPNLLFLSMMVATFSIRSLVYIWQFGNHPERRTADGGEEGRRTSDSGQSPRTDVGQGKKD